MFLFLSFCFSIDNQYLQLTSFTNFLNTSTFYSSNSKTLFLFSYRNQKKSHQNLSKFYYFSSPITRNFSQNLFHTDLHTFQNSILDRTIKLTSEDLQHPTDYISVDFKSPLYASSSVVLKDCKFNALSSTQGSRDQTTGGAFYSNGFQSTFFNCTFMGNSAQRAAACAIINTKSTFNLCRFYQNKANIDIGAILFDHCDATISDSYFVENNAILSIGAVLSKDSTLDFNVVVFHMNHAGYQTGALELFNSRATLNVNQFSNNSCTKESGGIVILGRNVSYLNLIGCNFETNVKDYSEKHPIVFDQSSYVTAKMNCFDTKEENIRSMISGSFSNDFNKFDHKCPCNHVSFIVPYDVTEINVKVQTNMINTDFFVNVLAIFIVMPCVVVFMTKKNKKKEIQFQRL